MKIFITGATGFIGSYLVKRLAQTNHEMICLVRRTSDISILKALRCTLFIGDVIDKYSLEKGMKGCDWVINLANVYSMWLPDNSLYHKINVIGTRNVMEYALAAGASRVVHVSTAAVYGKPVESPFTEDSEPGPDLFSEYARTKAEGDRIAWELHQNNGLPLTMLYPGICLGAGDTKASADYISLLVRRRLPAAVFSKSVFTWVHVQNVAEAIVRVLEKPDTIGQKYLIGNHRMSIQEFNTMVSRVAKVSPPVLKLTDPVTMATAYLLTGISNLIKFPPLFGMSIDQARTMKHGFSFDGSRAESKLVIKYSSVREALEEAINEIKTK
jgi:nucleoside-diphosphate-sugar epimerase